MTIKFQAAFKCPQCDSGQTHLEQVVVSQGNYITIVDRSNDRLIQASPHDRSGSVVDIYMWCDNGHTFTVSMEYIGGGVLSTVATGDPHEGDLGELWTRPE